MWCLFGDYQPKKLTSKSMGSRVLTSTANKVGKKICHCNQSIRNLLLSPLLSATVASCNANIAKVQGKVTPHGAPKRRTVRRSLIS